MNPRTIRRSCMVFLLLSLVLPIMVPHVWATSPTVVSATESGVTADDPTPFTVTRLAGVSGQLTIVVFATDGNPTLTYPSGYTEFCTVNRGGTFLLSIAYHQEDGTEGTSFDITSSASEKWAAIVYSISGAANPATRTPECTTVDGGTGTTANPDPPSITPTGGSKDYLFIAVGQTDGEEADDDTWGNTPPTNYTPNPPRQKATAIAGQPVTNTALETAERALTTAGPEDPGTFANDQALTYVAATIAIHPSTIQQFTRSASAGVTIAASLTRKLSAFRALAAPVTVAAVESEIVSFFRALTAPVTVAAVESEIAGFFRALSAAVTVTASVVRVASLLIGLVASITVAAVVDVVPTLQCPFTFCRNASASVTISGTLSRLAGFIRTNTASVTVADALTRLVSTFRTLAVSITVVTYNGLGFSRTVTAGVTIAGSVGRIFGMIRNLPADISVVPGLSYITSVDFGRIAIALFLVTIILIVGLFFFKDRIGGGRRRRRWG